MNRIRIIRDKKFYERVLAIALPVAAQQAINMGVNMMDTVMLGSFGEVQLSGSSLANSFYSLYTTLCMGIIGGGSVPVSQYWGAADKPRAKEVFSLAVRLAILLGLAFALVTWAFPAQIMSLFTSEQAVIDAGIRYLEITVFIYIIHGLSQVVSFLMRSVGQAHLGLIVSIVSFVVNLFANWVFIFGKFGMPRMEIAGAALGTLIARSAEFTVTFVYVLCIDKSLGLKLRDFLKNPSMEIIKKYFKLGAPALMSDGLLGLGNASISIVMGRMGAAVVAANSICQVIDRVFTVVIQGISNASSIVIGNTIGAGKREEALEQGQTFYLLSIIFGLVNGTLVFLIGPFTLGFYNLQADTVIIADQMMAAYGFITIFANIQSVMTKGVLRGGGDTKFLLKADILFLWIASIPLGILVGPVLGGPGWLTIICLRIDYVIKSIWCISRLNSGKWIRNVYEA